MPISLTKSKKSGAVLMRHPCEVCGGNAPFGFHVHMKQVYDLKDKGKLIHADNLLKRQRWFCGKHKEQGTHSD